MFFKNFYYVEDFAQLVNDALSVEKNIRANMKRRIDYMVKAKEAICAKDGITEEVTDLENDIKSALYTYSRNTGIYFLQERVLIDIVLRYLFHRYEEVTDVDVYSIIYLVRIYLFNEDDITLKLLAYLWDIELNGRKEADSEVWYHLESEKEWKSREDPGARRSVVVHRGVLRKKYMKMIFLESVGLLDEVPLFTLANSFFNRLMYI